MFIKSLLNYAYHLRDEENLANRKITFNYFSHACEKVHIDFFPRD
jgi:hypothetical protein